jgi:hypothetical protein
LDGTWTDFDGNGQLWLEVPLIAYDAIFNNVKGLDLLTRLNTPS